MAYRANRRSERREKYSVQVRVVCRKRTVSVRVCSVFDSNTHRENSVIEQIHCMTRNNSEAFLELKHGINIVEFEGKIMILSNSV